VAERVPATPALPTSAFRVGSDAVGNVQRAPLRVSSPEDASEREATAAARAVVTMSAPVAMHQSTGVIQRSASASPAGGSARIQSSVSGGAPLPNSARQFMEPRFGADFGAVRVHADANAGVLSRNLGARAFTTGNHVFFGSGEYQPDNPSGRELLAHELAHTVQQGAAPRDGTLQRSVDLTLTPQAEGVHRWGLADAFSSLAGLAEQLPGFRMFTLVLGVNPITQQPVQRSAANILRAVVEFMPGGRLVTDALDNYGIFDRVGTWIEQQLASLGLSGASIRASLTTFLDSLHLGDALDPAGVWQRARRIFSEPIDRIKTFVGNLAAQVVDFVKDAVLQPLARLAKDTRGWDLLCGVLGRNPITGEAVPRNAETLIGGFMKLIGQEEVWANIQRGNAVARAWAWFQGALAGVTGFVRELPAMFMQTLRALQIADLVQVPALFTRIGRTFGDFAGRFLSWAGEQVLGLLTIILEVVAPAVLVYVRRAGAAFRTIVENPARFLGHLVRAGLQGLNQFKDHFLTHLQTSLVGWLTGAMAGANIYVPQRLSLPEILKFTLSVLGLTWQNIRTKLVRVMGERTVAALETGVDLVVTLVREGPAAAWQQILEGISNLQEMVIGQIKSFVQNTIVTAAITRLVTSLNPIGGFIQAIIGMYNTFMFFRERLSQIAQVAASVIDAISAIANGVIGAAANRVEQTMAGMLTLVISFLARIAGLGRISEQVVAIVNRIRQPVDRALDRVVTWLVERARAVLSRLLGGAPDAPPQERLRRGLAEAVTAVNRLSGSSLGIAVIRPVLGVIRARHNMRGLEAVQRGNRWAISATVNPTAEELTQKLVDNSTAGATSRSYDGVNEGGFGKVARVENLTLIGAQNDPSVESLHWNRLRKRLFRAGASSFYYVRGHLINGTFGGPGSDWRNLTPLTQTANNRSSQSMLHTFERPVRDAVRADREENRGSATISVRIVYQNRGRIALATDIQNRPAALPGRSDEERRDIADIIRSEEHVPARVVAEATIRTRNHERRLSSVTDNVIDTDPSRYWHADHPPSGGAAQRTEVDLNTALRSELLSLVGVDPATATRIISIRQGRRFGSREGFLDRYRVAIGFEGPGEALLHAMRTTAGVRLIF
jgi:dolichol kinase